MFIYVHGFNSAPSSFKARLLKTRLEALGRAREFACPALSDEPSQAISAIERELADHDPGRVVLIGSSLGGYYATHLVEKHGVRAVLVNPAVRPYALLAAALGPQTNLYTGRHYTLTVQHLEALRALEVERFHTLARYLVIVSTGDEVLDYRGTLARYYGAEQIVHEGGDHGFGDFARYLDLVIEFADRA